MKKYIYSPDENRIKQISVFRVHKSCHDFYISNFSIDKVNTGTLEYKYADDCEIFNTYEVCAKNTIELKKKDAEEQKNKIKKLERIGESFSDEYYDIPEFKLDSDEILILVNYTNGSIQGLLSTGEYVNFEGPDIFNMNSISEIFRKYNGKILKYKNMKTSQCNRISSIDLDLIHTNKSIDLSHPKTMMSCDSDSLNGNIAFLKMIGHDVYIIGSYTCDSFLLSIYGDKMISCFDYYTKTIREEKKKLIKIEHEINAISLRETI